MSSLGFDLLDRHVVDGRGDDLACSDGTGTLTYARLLERSAALAGGLRAVGVQGGDTVAVLVERGNLQVTVVCACLRLGVVPGRSGDVRVVGRGERAVVQMGEDDIDLSVVMKAGATDPAPSLPIDPPGLHEAVRSTFGDVIETLFAGRLVN